tara:strand:- start:184 stop:765 length:582 start_codon:yes stop_codon:yes gene_type:complete
MESYYIINSYIDEKFISSSDIFYDIKKIKEVKNILDTNSNTKNVIFECKPIDESIDESTTKLYKYLKGYLLVPNKSDPYYEMERLNNGDWCDDLKGWYYNKEELKNLQQRGYTIDSKLKVDYTNYDIKSLEIYFYDNGFILSPSQSYKYYGQKYLLGGTWDDKQKGWYFKNIKKYNKFINMGAIDLINDTFME